MPRRSNARRFAKVVVLAVIVAGTCVRLGFWQISRLHQRNAFVAALHSGLAAAPVPIDSLLPADRTVDVDAIRYRRVTATGTYDATNEVVLYGRGLSADVDGNHVLTPLVLSDGSAVIVDRGWVPIRDQTLPVPGAQPPSGPVTVSGILIPSEGGLPGEGGGPPLTETTRVDLAQLASQVPYRIRPLWLLLQTQSPAQASLPRHAPFLLPPAPPHLSYAIQWFSFAVIALGGAGLLIRRELRTPDPSQARADAETVTTTEAEPPDGPSQPGPSDVPAPP